MIRLGEHNYLFAGSDAIYVVLATERSQRLNLFDYLADVPNQLSGAELLPHRWKQRNGAADAP